MSVILVVDDDAPTREALASGLKKSGHEIHLAGTGAAALDEVRRHPVDLAIIDLKLPDMTGTELFGALRILRPEAIAIMISGAATVDEAVSALKRGIYDFITKDFRMGDLRKVVGKALETQQLLVENQRLREALQDRGPTGRLIGRGPAILKVLHLISQVAPMKSTVLYRRGVRGGQGTHRRSHPPPEPPAAQAPGQTQLRRPARGAHRIGAFRPRERRLHRGHPAAQGPLRTGRRRHHLSGRNQ